jgi:thiamine biosynthesis lipoprotein
MELDFGGFGKEYAADRAATVLMAQGVRHGYVNLAGDIRLMGPRPDGQAWSIGIQDPRQPERLVASIALGTGAIATSGDYARGFDQGGRRWCHILDPRSGMPVQVWRSVSVCAPTALAAGALATIAMLQQEQALAFLDRQEVLYLAVDQAGTLHGPSDRSARPAQMGDAAKTADPQIAGGA